MYTVYFTYSMYNIYNPLFFLIYTIIYSAVKKTVGDITYLCHRNGSKVPIFLS